MELKHELLETVVDRNAAELRDQVRQCLEAAKSQKDAAIRQRLLERGLKLAQQAEAMDRQPPLHSDSKGSGTPGPETG
jgi:hypothetical protein